MKRALPKRSPAAADSQTDSAPVSRGRKRGDSELPSKIRFSATLLRPKAIPRANSKGIAPKSTSNDWTFLVLPPKASAKLPSRGQTTVKGTFNGAAFCATLEPDGQGGHWLKVDRKLRASSGTEVGDQVELEIAPVPPDQEPEPKVPADLRTALAADSPGAEKARAAWSTITPLARRDWIHWITSAKQAATRERRVTNACDMLAKGKRRPCCFDRSGMYAKSMSCPEADVSA